MHRHETGGHLLTDPAGLGGNSLERNSSRDGPHRVNRQQGTHGAEEGALCYAFAGTKRLECLVIRIRPARPDEAGALTGLVLRSKAHWGYREEFLALCREELTLRPAELEALRAHVAERDGGPPLGVLTIRGAPPEGTLEHLYGDRQDCRQRELDLDLRDTGRRTARDQRQPTPRPMCRGAVAAGLGSFHQRVHRRVRHLDAAAAQGQRGLVVVERGTFCSVHCDHGGAGL